MFGWCFRLGQRVVKQRALGQGLVEELKYLGDLAIPETESVAVSLIVALAIYCIANGLHESDCPLFIGTHDFPLGGEAKSVNFQVAKYLWRDHILKKIFACEVTGNRGVPCIL